jgi:hypothetical protein
MLSGDFPNDEWNLRLIFSCAGARLGAAKTASASEALAHNLIKLLISILSLLVFSYD